MYGWWWFRHACFVMYSWWCRKESQYRRRQHPRQYNHQQQPQHQQQREQHYCSSSSSKQQHQTGGKPMWQGGELNLCSYPSGGGQKTMKSKNKRRYLLLDFAPLTLKPPHLAVQPCRPPPCSPRSRCTSRAIRFWFAPDFAPTAGKSDDVGSLLPRGDSFVPGVRGRPQQSGQRPEGAEKAKIGRQQEGETDLQMYTKGSFTDMYNAEMSAVYSFCREEGTQVCIMAAIGSKE